MSTRFFKCTICGNVVVKLVDSGVGTVCCGKAMVELMPGTTDGKVEYHVPEVVRSGARSISVNIGAQPHPMTPEHHILFIYLEQGDTGQIHYLKEGEPATAVFPVCPEKPMVVYAYCNLHGLWKTEVNGFPKDDAGDDSVKAVCVDECDTKAQVKCDEKGKKSCAGGGGSDGESCGIGRRVRNFLCRFMLLLLPMFAISCNARTYDNTTVSSLDLSRFTGRWYELARFDHSFERGMVSPVAEYTMLPNGKIRVINTGIVKGKLKTSVGRAKVTDVPGLLRVSFFGPFYSDYRIMMLDKNYQYALIGSGTDDYLWILSRQPSLSDEVRNKILNEACLRGYDTSKLLWMHDSGSTVKKSESKSRGVAP